MASRSPEMEVKGSFDVSPTTDVSEITVGAGVTLISPLLLLFLLFGGLRVRQWGRGPVRRVPTRVVGIVVVDVLFGPLRRDCSPTPSSRGGSVIEPSGGGVLGRGRGSTRALQGSSAVAPPRDLYGGVGPLWAWRGRKSWTFKDLYPRPPL